MTGQHDGDWLPATYVAGLVSVIVPTFNRPALTIELLNNLAKQSWPDLEILVIDDGSTDGTEGAVSAWIAGPRPNGLAVELLSQDNAGPGAARNRGFATARGEFFFCIDSDDLAYPTAIATMVRAIQASGRPYCLAPIAITGVDGVAVPDEDEGIVHQIAGNVLASNWMTHGALYRRAAVALAGPYHADLRIGEDTEFHWRIAAVNGPAVVLDEVVGERRVHPQGQLSIRLVERDQLVSSVRVRAAFLRWAMAHNVMSPAIELGIVSDCLISGIKLGFHGVIEGKQLAFATIAAANTFAPRRAALIAWLGRPNSRAYFAPFRLALWAAKQLRKLKPSG